MYESVFDYSNAAFEVEGNLMSYLIEVYDYGKSHELHISKDSEDVMTDILDEIKKNLLERKEVTEEELEPFNIQLSVFIFDKTKTSRFLLHPGVHSYGTPFEIHKLRDYCHKIYQYPKNIKTISHDGYDPTPILHVFEGTNLSENTARVTLSLLTKNNKREYYFILQI